MSILEKAVLESAVQVPNSRPGKPDSFKIEINNELQEFEYTYDYDVLIPENKEVLEIYVEDCPEEIRVDVEQAIREHLEEKRG